MKKHGKRILSMVLVLWMAISSECDLAVTYAADDTQNTDSQENSVSNGISAEGEGTVGTLLANTISDEISRTQTGAHINTIEVEGTTATVNLEAYQDAELVVAVYEEDSRKMLAAGRADVVYRDQECEITQTVELETESMPQYFEISAYLLDPESHVLLCDAYDSSLYTEAIQTLRNSKASDFDAERTVILDSDTEDSFVVYNEDTVVLENSDSSNSVSQQEDGTWKITYAGDEAKQLEEGDIVAFQYEDGTIDVFEVQSVTVDGDTVLVTEGEDEIGLMDIFECVRIDSDLSGDSTVDMSNASSGVTYEGSTVVTAETDTESASADLASTESYDATNSEEVFSDSGTSFSDDEAVPTEDVFLSEEPSSSETAFSADDGEENISLAEDGEEIFAEGDEAQTDAQNLMEGSSWNTKHEFSIDYGIGEYKKENSFVTGNSINTYTVEGSLKVTGKVTFEADGKVEVDLFKGYSYVEASISPSLGVTVSITAKGSLNIPLGSVHFEPVPGIYIMIDLSFAPEVSGSLEYKNTISGKFGAYYYDKGLLGNGTYDGEKVEEGAHGIREVNSKQTLKVKGKVFIGFKIDIGIALLGEDFAYIALEAKLGVQFEAEDTVESVSYDTEEIGKKHECALCYAITVKPVLSLSFKTKLVKIVDYTWTIFDLDNYVDGWKFYWSVTYDELKAGECPHYVYALDVNTVDPEYQAASDVGIQVTGVPNTSTSDETDYTDAGFEGTTQNGTVRFWAHSGTYKIEAATKLLRGSTSVSIDDEPESVMLLLSKKKYIVTVTVVDSEGTAVSGAEAILSGGQDSDRTSTTLSSGKAIFTGVTPGTYEVSVVSGDLQGSASFTVEDEAVNVTVTLDGKTGEEDSGENLEGDESNGVFVMDSLTVKITGGGSFAYTGSPITPGVTVIYHETSGDVTMTEGEDYTLSYEDNTDIGEAWILITATGKESEDDEDYFEGSASVYFQITGSLSIDFAQGDGTYAYTGSEICPEVTVIYDGETLTDGYTVTYGDNVEAGWAYVRVTANGQTARLYYEITEDATDVTSTDFAQSDMMSSHDGSEEVIDSSDTAQNEAFSSSDGTIEEVTDEGEISEADVQDIDSEAEDTDAQDIAPEEDLEAIFEAPEEETTADGGFADTDFSSGTEETEISGISMDSAAAETGGDEDGILFVKSYSGTVSAAEDSSRTVIFTGLSTERDYLLVSVIDTDAEKLFAPSNLLYISQETSDAEGKITFTYIPREDADGTPVAFGPGYLKDAQITAEDLTYTGEAQDAAIKVLYEGNVLTEGTDYILYGDTTVTDAGNYNVLVTGLGEYRGSVTVDYTVNKVEQEFAAYIEAAELTIGSSTAIRTQGGEGSISYQSDHPEIAAVDSAGNVSAVAVGTAVITVTASGDENYFAAEQMLTVSVKAGTGASGTSGSSGTSDASGTSGDSGTSNAAGEAGSAAGTEASQGEAAIHEHSFTDWETLSEATVFEAETQTRTCASCGTAEIRTVGEALTPTIRLNSYKFPLQKGKSTTALKVSGLANGDYVKSWSVKNKKIASVNAKGKIKGKKVGKTTVTVTLASGKTATATVIVQKKKVTTKKLGGIVKKLTLKAGSSVNLTPVLSPITSTDKVTYRSSNKKIAVVSAKGKITAKKKGTVTITVKSGKKTKKIKVTVK